MVRRQKNRTLRCLTALAASAAAVAATAATVQVSADAGVGRTDNVTRVADDERSATIRSAGLRFSVLHETRRANVDMLGDLSWLDYAGDIYSSELVGSAAGRVRLDIVDERFNWVVEDSFGQVRRDLFGVPGPDNRENINYFSTGPNLRFALGSYTNLLLGGRYALVDYERSVADSRRTSGSLGVERVLAQGATLSLNASAERIEGRGASISPDYDREAIYLRYGLTGRRASVGITAGANRVGGGVASDSGALLRLDLQRNVGRLSVFNLRLGRELTDSGSSLELQESGQLPTPDAGTGISVQTSQPYTGTYVEGGWQIVGRRTSIGLEGGWRDQDYSGPGSFDLKRTTLGLNVNRAVGVRTSAMVGMRFARNDFNANDVDNDELTYLASLSWAAGRRLSFDLAGEHFAYSSDLQPTIHETRFWLRARYGQRIER